MRSVEQQPKLTVRCVGVYPKVCAERGSQLPFLLLFIATESVIRVQNIPFDLVRKINDLEHCLSKFYWYDGRCKNFGFI